MPIAKLEFLYDLISTDNSSLEEKITYLKYLLTISNEEDIPNILEVINKLEQNL